MSKPRRPLVVWLAIAVAMTTGCQRQTISTEAGPTVNPDFRVNADLAAVGRDVFIVKDCKGCHTIGGGRSSGPDLFGVTERRTIDWLTRFISDTGEMLDTDPIAQALKEQFHNVRMPDIEMTAREVEALIHYLADATARRRGMAAGEE